MEEALIAILLASPAVRAIADARIFPGMVPQGEVMPAVVVNVISGARQYADDGEVGLADVRIQIDAWALTFTDAKRLGRAVTAALSGFDGQVNDVEFQSVTQEDERDLQEGGSNAAEYRFRNSRDFIVWHRPV